VAEGKKPKGSGTDSAPATNQISAPTISLPKGGGAIRGMGEKFAANPVTGTGSMSVPIVTSPGRSGFGPQLSLLYDSGAGNGPFGLGWNLSLPSITRKTDTGLPRYHDVDESDVFILSGAEDLVPVLKPDRSRYEDTTTVPGYTIRRYQPRIEGLFARIERWTNAQGVSHWRSISKDNITTLYGSSDNSRVVDQAVATHTFSWLICESYDDKGNAIVYEYVGENDHNVDHGQANERNREHMAGRYLKRIKYGNHVSRLIQPDLHQQSWLFEVVFDYGDHDLDVPLRDEPGKQWPVRQDPFSSYRAGFEVRTYRICRRVLMFHHFSELGVTPCLVRSTDFNHAQGPVASFITSVIQSGYKRIAGTYRKKSLPPVEFEYSQAVIQENVCEVDAASLENLPQGLDHSRYQWADLDGEGLSGILTEQGGAWFYKRNQSAVPVKDAAGKETTVARFAPLECVATMPSSANLNGGQQLLDLAGDGQLDVVDFDGPAPGFFERTLDEEWETHKPFSFLPNIAWRDANLKFIDLTGDGHADILITEDQAFIWYPSLAEAGFGPAENVRQAIDEEQGPRLVFADGTQSIYLADMSGDGLTDLVRIRNGEVCYWPNLGYARFGAKVTMDKAPWFDAPDMFEQRRIRLADIDGSGLVDILYLTGHGVHLYFNQSGNAWSERRILSTFPRIDNLSAVSTVDLLGNGTACLVWSSSLPGDARSTIRYIDLMGGQKPHLLIKTINNLGGETEVMYAPSTKFYLQDKQAGTPWITKLPFPVHCVEKVTIRDKWRQTEFASSYSYHHGYFDGIEREFRGFGRVEQRDVETYGKFMQGNAASPYITDDHDLYQPPIKTITWYHTGAAFERDRILSALQHEYVAIPGFTEHQLPEPTLTPADLSAEEWRDALRACKGMVLRQEVFELDVDALDQGTELPVHLYTTAYHNSNITCVQPQGINCHAVFLVTESEAITYTYELDLRQTAPSPDPRIAHTLNLNIDEFGNILESVAAVYPRRGITSDTSLSPEQRDLIDQVQKNESHLALNCTGLTEDIDDPNTYRLRMSCQTQTWEVTGIQPAGTYFTLVELKNKNLSGVGVSEISYHRLPDGTPQKRLVECARTLFFADDLKTYRPFRQHGPLGLPYESYKLALTKNLIHSVYVDAARITTALSALDRQVDNYPVSGYYKGDQLFAGDPITPEPLENQYWLASGRAGFENDADQHFYLSERYTDPFGNIVRLKYDSRDLFIQSSTDMQGNTTGVIDFDYRVLAPIKLNDINDNETEAYFDVLGMVVAMAAKGKDNEGDNLHGFTDALANPPTTAVVSFCTSTTLNAAQASTWLANASARFVYHFGEHVETNGTIVWNHRMAGACGIVRERHASQVALDPAQEDPLQVSLECSDGSGNVLMKKMQADPDPITGQAQWIVNGLTVLNNKGKPVKQYEPAYSDRFGCEMPQANGVTPIMYYDAAGRRVRTEMPDGSYSRVTFSPWQVKTFDANDTVLESPWYQARGAPDPTAPLASNASPDTRAAWLAAHHANTPAQLYLDSLGRGVIAVAHNRVKDTAGNWQDEAYLTLTKLDAEGKPLWIRDARGNLAMQYIAPAKPNNDPSNTMPASAVPCYDIAGNLLYQHSMDAGDRWMLMDAAGKPMLAWDLNETPQGTAAIRENRFYRTDYDPLHRPAAQWLTINNGSSVKVERYEYQDAVANDVNNLNGQLVRHYDPSGRIETIRRDFKGNVQEIHRTLTRDATVSVVNWDVADATALSGLLEQETYVQLTEHDALNRMTRLYNWHRPAQNSMAIYLPRYNRRGLLESEDLVLRATSYDPASGTLTKAVQTIRYNAKGQKTYLQAGNGTVTRYEYDPRTFRLIQLRTTRPNQDPSFPGTLANLADQNVLQQLHYTYDPVGSITETYDEAYKPAFFANVMVEPRSRYEYDATYRLISATGRENSINIDAPGQFDREEAIDFPVQDGNALRNYTQRYQYDNVGNIQQMRHVVTSATGGWTRDYAYACDDPLQPASNRLWQTWTGGDRTQAVTYGYDTHGNMLNLARIDPRFNLQWDHLDMINSINLGGGGTAFYQYDNGKQRSRKRIVNQNGGGGYWERIYLGGYERYRRYNGNSSTAVEETESHHLFEGEQPVLLVDDVIVTNRTHADGRTYKTGPIYRYQYSNHLGSACLELDHEAAIISYEEYHPYGTSAYRARKRDSEAPPKRYRYTGMERDEESGLGYHLARYYWGVLGRWVNVDPIGTSGGLNVFQYCSSSPIKRTDASGTQDRPSDHHKPCMSECHPDPTERDRELAKTIEAELPRQPVMTPENRQLLSAVIDDFETVDLPKWVEAENSRVRVQWDDRIDDPEHVKRVQTIINMALLKTALKLGDGDHSTQEMLEVAADYVQSMRRQQVAYVPKLPNASTSVLLRDAHYYFWGRSGPGVLGDSGRESLSQAGLGLFRPLHQAKKEVEYYFGWDSGVAGPSSSNGGYAWFRLGLSHEVSLRPLEIGETSPPRLINAMPKLTADEREKILPSMKNALERVNIFRKPVGQLK